MELLPTALSLGWASGVNAYGTVALLGILGRTGTADVPEPLTGIPVIAIALVMYAVEFVVDKIPYLDNTWDAIHTAIRPAVGGALGIAYSDQDQITGSEEVFAVGGGGAAALVSHAIKAGTRLAINASPEPVSNILVSLTEDGMVYAIVRLAVENPELALAITAGLVIGGIVLVVLLWRAIRRAWRRRRERREAARRGVPP